VEGRKVRVITLTVVLVYLLSILAGAPVIRYLVPFFFVSKKIIRHEIQLIDELVVVSFEPPDARPACDRIRRHFVNAEW
jgi:hypothetical protein